MRCAMARQSWIPVLAWTVSSVLVGCSGSKSAGSPGDDVGHDGGEGFDGSAFYPDGTAQGGDTGTRVTTGDAAVRFDAGKYTSLPPPPQVANAGGGVLASPEIVAIFFDNDDPALLPSLEQFYMGIGSSTYWTVAAEYGVGPATATIVVLPDAAPATIDDTSDAAGDNTALENWLLGEINANPSPLPAWTPNTTYMINYPNGTTVTSDGTQCVDFDGYHSDFQNAAMSVTYSYGVIPRCTDPMSTVTKTFTSTVSHELIEAATDPYPDYSAAWSQADIPHLFWDEANDGSEIADMCENDPEAYQVEGSFPFTVQRIWSNKAVLAGHDPCVPAITAPFFNAAPELPDTGLFAYDIGTVNVSSAHIPVGGTGTVYLDVYSDGAMADWDVQVWDYNDFYEEGSALLTINTPITTANDGARIPVSITVNAAGNATTNGQVDDTELFVVVSSQGTSQTAPAHFWYGIVTN
jgi:hypothetical protein